MMLILSCAIFIAYFVGIFVLNKGLYPSISDGYYILKEKANKLADPVFFFSMIGIGVPFMIYGLNFFGDLNYSFLIFLSGGGLCFVGTAAQFREDFVKKIHVVAAIVCGISITIWTIIYGSSFLLISLASLFLIIGILDKKNRRQVLYFELFAFINAYLQFIFI